MNKSSLSQNHILRCAVFIFIACVASSLMPMQTAKADAAPPPDPTVGGVGPYQPQKTNVQMMSETVLIDVPASPSSLEEPKQIKVSASFMMRNQGQTEEQMQVIFPLTRLNTGGSEEALYRIDFSSFAVTVNELSLPITTITTPPEMTASDADHGFNPNVQWAAFDVSFPVHQDVLLEVEYEMLNPYGEYGEGFTGIAYILETGAGWYGNILSADITLRLPYLVTEEVINSANPGYTISGKEMHWSLKNLEPTRHHNLEVRVIHVDQWQAILRLRTEVERRPNDANSWAALADWYQIFSIHSPFGEQDSPAYTINHHFANLTLEARQKVVSLRPEWGNAHFRLAQILWFTNPAVEDRFGYPAKKTDDIQPDEPSIQEVLHELELAWSYGFDGNVDVWDVENFQRIISNAVPGLELPSSATATATFAGPPETLAPTATETLPPTASPTFTLEPVISLTPVATTNPVPTSNNLLLTVALSLITIGGISIYLLKPKH